MANRALEYIINLHDGSFGRTMNRAQGQVSRMDDMASKLGRTLGAAFAVHQIGAFIKDTTDTYSHLEALDKRLNVASRTQENYQKNQAFINQTVKDLKLPIIGAQEAFSKLVGSTRGTNLEGEKTREVFQGVAIAARTMKLDSDASGRVFNSLAKMISTGTVQADEFKNMLAEALPGAAEMGAKAMNMTMPQFFKEMEKGTINSAGFVTKFSALLQNEYGGRLPEVLNSVQARMVDASNKIIEKQGEIGEKTSVIYLMWLDAKLKLIEAVGWLIEKYEQYKTAIHGFLAIAGGVVTAMTAMWMVSKLNAYWSIVAGKAQIFYRTMTIASAMGTNIFKAAWIALNATFAASPIGLIITAIGALIGLAIWAYGEFDQFRAVIDGLGATAVRIFETMYNWLKVLMAPIRIVVAFISEGPEGAKKAMENIKNDALNVVDGFKDVYSGDAFMEGYNKSLQKTRDKKAAEGAGAENPFGASAEGTVAPATADTSTNASVSAGRSVRNVSIQIDALVKEFTIQTTNIKEGAQNAKKMIQDTLIRAVLDSEAAL